MLTKQRTRVLEEVEKLLVFLNEKQLEGDTGNEDTTCEKARTLHSDLPQENPFGVQQSISLKPVEDDLINSTKEVTSTV